MLHVFNNDLTYLENIFINVCVTAIYVIDVVIK